MLETKDISDQRFGRKAKDYNGRKFELLTVLHRTVNRELEIKRKSAIWVCQCVCGKVIEVESNRLKNMKSCGCINKTTYGNVLAEDLTGKTFGRLTVIERAENSKSKKVRWLCKCECGNEKIIIGDNLKKGKTFSCGCFRSEKISSLHLEDLTGQKFERLTVLYRGEDDQKNDKTRWVCECHCGDIILVSSNALKSGNTKSCGCLVSDILHSRTHENHPNWKGTTNLKLYLRSKITEWKKLSMENSNFKCVITGESFDAIHHLFPFHKIVDLALKELKTSKKEQINEYSIEELTLIENKIIDEHYRYPLGVCLTDSVHKEFHSKYGQINFSPEDFQEFFYLKTGKEFIISEV